MTTTINFRATVNTGISALERHLSTRGACSGELDAFAKECLSRAGRKWLYANLPPWTAPREAVAACVTKAVQMAD